ncbi:MAG TPA: DNA polymerase III subunit delta [Planctomycetes bacterium]|nr:DNA polymerase III subunit delta [Planctomycetota bacterium]
MAAKAKKTKQHAKSVCVVCGKDEFLVANRCEALVDELLTPEQRPMCLYQPRADEVAAADVFDELRTLPFLADRRVVLIRDADKFVSANRGILEKYFDDPSPTGVLILTVASWPGNTKLAKKLPKVGELVKVTDIARRSLAGYVAGYTRDKHGKTFAPGAAQLLVELAGDEPGRLCSEADKLAMYVGDEKNVTVKDVEALTGRNRMFNAFAVIDAVTEGNVAAAVGRLRNMFASDKQAEYKVVGAFAYHFRRMFKAAAMLDKGANRNQVARQLGLWHNVDGFFGQISRISLKGIGCVLTRLARIDYLTKTGQADVKIAVEQLILSLTAKQKNEAG